MALTLGPPSDDAYIADSAPNTNYGNEATLQIQGVTGNGVRSLVKFDLSTSSLSHAWKSATLWLYCISLSGVQNRTVDIYRCTSAWAEGTVTWNTLPTLSGTPMIQQDQTVSPHQTASTWHSFPLLIAEAKLMRDTNHGLLLKLSSEGNIDVVQWASSEHATTTIRPYLVVTSSAGNQVIMVMAERWKNFLRDLKAGLIPRDLLQRRYREAVAI